MARTPTPALRVYESNSAPRAEAAPFRRAPDQGDGIGASLSRLGQSIQTVAETDQAVQQMRAREAEDAGRIQAAQRMAQFRADAAQMSRDVFEASPNGYENATHTAAANFENLRQRYLTDGLGTPDANRFFQDATALWQPDFLDGVAAQESHNRDQYQADTITQTIEANANLLIANPSQYDQIHQEMMATVGGVSNPNLRRDATNHAEGALAAAAVSGLINLHPQQALSMLQDPHATGAVTRLTAQQRDTAINQARSEIQRRQAQAQVATAQAASTAQARWALGLDAPGAPSFDAVYNTLGPQAALTYETTRLQGQHTGELVNMPSADLAALAARANDPQAAMHGRDLHVGGNRHTGAGESDIHDAIQAQARAQAAAAILQERFENPMQQQVRQGLVPQADLVGAVTSGDWGMVNGILANRAAAAEQNGARLGMPAMPLTAFEAQNLGPVIRNMSAQDRLATLRNFAAWTGGGQAYQNMMGQLFPASPASAYAGYITGLRGTHGAANAPIILRGEELLAGNDPAAPAGQPRSGQRANAPLVTLPDNLRAAWAGAVGDAYSGWGDQSPDNQAEEKSYQVFRSAFAALSYDARDPAPAAATISARSNRVRDAVRIATGGITDWGGHRTIVPPGMTAQEFDAGVRAGFTRAGQANVDPSQYALRPLQMTAHGGGLYAVFNHDDPVHQANGASLVIEVRR